MAGRGSISWGSFVSATKSRKPISYIDEAARLLEKRGLAVDLGSGAGVDARHLAEIGFQVMAIDNDSAALRATKALCKGLAVNVKRNDIRKVRLPPGSVSLVIAWNSLPFLKKSDFKRVMQMIQIALIQGGIFVFSVFGPDDGWAKNRTDMSFVSRHEFEQCLNQARFIEVRETWREGPDALGNAKFWHRLQGITRKVR